MTLHCDHCTEWTEDYEDTLDAAENGWWFLEGPGGDFCFCSKECLELGLPSVPEETIDVPDTYDFDAYDSPGGPED